MSLNGRILTDTFRAALRALQRAAKPGRRASLMRSPEPQSSTDKGRSMINNTGDRSLEHTWESSSSIDEGVYSTYTLRLKLYFSPALDKYVVSGRGADASWGRHWNREGIPDQLFSNYADALRAYRELAKRYAPSDVVTRVVSDVERALKMEGPE